MSLTETLNVQQSLSSDKKDSEWKYLWSKKKLGGSILNKRKLFELFFGSKLHFSGLKKLVLNEVNQSTYDTGSDDWVYVVESDADKWGFLFYRLISFSAIVFNDDLQKMT